MAMSKRYEQRLAEYNRLAKKADAQLRSLERAFKFYDESHDQKLALRRQALSKSVKGESLTKAEKSALKMTKDQLRLTRQRAKTAERIKQLPEYAYSSAQKDIQRLYGSGDRFHRVPKKNGEYISLDELNKRIEAIQRFISKPSSRLTSSKGQEGFLSAQKRSVKAFSEAIRNRLNEGVEPGDKMYITEKELSFTPEEMKDLMDKAKEQGLLHDYGKYEAIEAIYEYQNDDDLRDAIADVISDRPDSDMSQSQRDALATKLMREFEDRTGSKHETLASMISNGVDMSVFEE